MRLFFLPGSLGCLLCACFAVALSGQSDGGRYPIKAEISLAEYMQRVVEYNESVQGRLLGFHAARRQRQAEAGAFEPAFVATAEYVDRRQANTIELERSLRSGGLFTERNKKYTSAVEMLTPLGTRFRIGATGRELVNNIQRTVLLELEAEFEMSMGVSVEQPLLKGMGLAANLASMRLAARQSDIAFQDYRRELMQVVAQAELAYWQLFYAQEELALSRESVAVAQTLSDDSRASFDAGRGSQLDVLEAEAGHALRRARESASAQRRVEALNQMASFFGGAPRENLVDYIARDQPESKPVTTSFSDGLHTAMAMNPDFLRVQAQKEQERIRLGYARNQWLPELNLTASYGASGLGYDWNTAWDDVERSRFPAWTVGVVMRLPIWGDVRGRNEWRAARLRVKQAERAEASLMTQLRVGTDSSEQRVEAAYASARSLESIVAFRENLLETRMMSRDVGRMDARSVLEAEQELFVARLEQLQSEVEYQRALLELQITAGNLLQLRGLDLGPAQLERETAPWTRQPGRLLAALDYEDPDLTQLPAGEPVRFKPENPAAPWMGINWRASDSTPEYDDDATTTGSSAPRRGYRRPAGARVR